MAFLQPDKVITEKIGTDTIKINQKITPDGAVATKYIASYVKEGDLVKPNLPIGGNGKPRGITVHNTEDISVPSGTNPAEQYARATYPNGNMAGSVVHYWVYKEIIWQQLRDNERGWHASDGVRRSTGHRGTKIGGNLDTISIECIESKSDSTSEDTLAKLVAILCNRYSLDPQYDVYTHNYWMLGKDKYVPGAAKNCPYYILDHWDKFLDKVQAYYNTIKGINNESKPVTTTVTGTVSTGSEADEKIIWDFLYSKLGNKYGVAGLMGNLYAESSLRSNNLQSTYEKKLGYTDETYTKAVDNGTYSNFVKDSAGYGLAQWTYYTRKQKLLDYAKSKKKSIGDLTTQLEFLYKEISESYKVVLNDLKNAKDVLSASNSVLTKFEKPADQGTTMKNKRAGYGQTYYDKYASGKTTTTTTSKPSTTTSNKNYSLKEFVTDVQKACGASVDGIAGPETLSKTVTVSAIKNRKHDVVVAIQKRLYALGYTEVGTADGIAGSKFTAAVTRFQKENKLVSDGEITAQKNTWRKLLGLI